GCDGLMGLEGISVIDWSSNFSADWVDLVDKNSLIEDNCSTWKQEEMRHKCKFHQPKQL
ncbi:unnamed protein product, partial [Onchocerca ochengi]|uniref:C-type lectin domain-containing protein n=1 Tax=Onchocerca ochengi TaxID=42157 RepID=A0A182EBR7_ONCOC